VLRWLQGNEAPRDHDEDVEEARRQLRDELHLTPAQIEQQLDEWAKSEPAEKIPPLVLPADCRDAVLTFVACATQWDYISPGLGKPIPNGLNYSRVESVLRMRRVSEDRWPELFDDLRYMESIALPHLAN